MYTGISMICRLHVYWYLNDLSRTYILISHWYFAYMYILSYLLYDIFRVFRSNISAQYTSLWIQNRDCDDRLRVIFIFLWQCSTLPITHSHTHTSRVYLGHMYFVWVYNSVALFSVFAWAQSAVLQRAKSILEIILHSRECRPLYRCQGLHWSYGLKTYTNVTTSWFPPL